jgi:deoxycytidine triphosphate deaminase
MTTQRYGLLCGEEIKSGGLVKESADKFYRAATYDLSVGDIILDGGKTWEGSTYDLKPGGMVRVVSKESLALPDNVTGHVLLKNGLCTRGVLAINIGIVDPGFEGPISSTLINFGRADFAVEKGTSFLRVSFHHCPQSTKAVDAPKYDRETYLKQVKQEVQAYSGPTFLNMDATAADAATKAFDSFKNALFGWATVVGLFVAVLAIFAPLGASFVDKHLTKDEQHEAQVEQAVEKKVEERYAGQLKELSDKVDRLSQVPPQTSRNRTTPSGNDTTR